MLIDHDPYNCFMAYGPVQVASADPGYPDGPLIVNRASQLFIDLWGDAGCHARTAVNAASLPANALVQVDAVVELA
jgi:enamine deaminase RidA (YjgF/YER057c/UK114 family)